jgi:hypothetical protein
MLNIDIGAIKVLSMLLINVYIKLVYLVKHHQVWIIKNTINNSSLKHLITTSECQILLRHILGHLRLIIVLVSLVEQH